MTETLQGQPLTILLIEDDPAHAELITRCFANHKIGNQLFHVTGGEQAMDYLYRRGAYADAARSPRPHLILLDLKLPGIGGLDVLKEIKESDELKIIPTVILTTSKAPPDIKSACERHADSYVIKPMDFEKFHQLIDELGFYWLVWNQRPSSWRIA